MGKQRSEQWQPNAAFWQGVAERLDNPFTPAKVAALEAGAALPVEPFDFVSWPVSFTVCGWVIPDSAGRAFINPGLVTYNVWNPISESVEQVVADQMALQGYPA